MDIVSHALWGATVVRKKRLAWWAALIGAAPDLLSNGVAFFYLLVAHSRLWSASTWPLLPDVLKNAYHATHSAVGVLVVIGIFFLFFRKYMALVVPYALHVMMDLFTHAGNIWDRLLFPFDAIALPPIYGSNWWEAWWIWGLNAALLVAINLWIWSRQHTGQANVNRAAFRVRSKLSVRNRTESV